MLNTERCNTYTAKALQSLGQSPKCTVLTRHMLPMRQSSVQHITVGKAQRTFQGAENLIANTIISQNATVNLELMEFLSNAI
jgi:hypothetical protein